MPEKKCVSLNLTIYRIKCDTSSVLLGLKRLKNGFGQVSANNGQPSPNLLTHIERHSCCRVTSGKRRL